MTPLALDDPEILAIAAADPAARRLLDQIRDRYAHRAPEDRPRICPAELLRCAGPPATEAPDPPPDWPGSGPGPVWSGRWPDHADREDLPRGDGRLAVVVPARGRAATLARALASLAAQHWDGWHGIIVLAGRVSLSEVHLDALSPYLADPRFAVLARPDLTGIAGPVAAGLEAARGAEFAAVLDDESQWHPEFLGQLVAVLEADRTLGLAYAGATHAEADGRDGRLAPHPAMDGRSFRYAITQSDWLGWARCVFRPDRLGPDGVAVEAAEAAAAEAWLRIAATAGAYHLALPLVRHHTPAAGVGGRGWAWVQDGIESGRYGAIPEPPVRSDGNGQAPVVTTAPDRPRRGRLASCVFAGEAVLGADGRQEMRDCPTCSGTIRLKLFACNHLGHATDPTTTEKACRICGDYEERGP